MKERKCRKCKEVKPIEEFYPNGKGGHHSYCKVCQSELSKLAYKKKPKINKKKNFKFEVDRYKVKCNSIDKGATQDFYVVISFNNDGRSREEIENRLESLKITLQLRLSDLFGDNIREDYIFINELNEKISPKAFVEVEHYFYLKNPKFLGEIFPQLKENITEILEKIT